MSNRKTAVAGYEGKSPVTIYPTWRSEEKKFRYFNKALGEKGENEYIELPCSFVVLSEDYATVGGYNAGMKMGYYSNEVPMSELGNLPLAVRSNKKDNPYKQDGLWLDIKDAVKMAGGKFQKNVYVMFYDGTLGRLTLGGAPLFDWGEFRNGLSREQIGGHWITVASTEARKNGSNEFNVPVFELGAKLTNKQEAQADAAFEKVDEYLKAKIAEAKSGVETPVAEGSVVDGGVNTDTAPTIDVNSPEYLAALALLAQGEAQAGTPSRASMASEVG